MENNFVIIVPSYNNERWVNQNISSIINQTYQNYRVIYINDCSTDRTLEMVQNLVKRYGKEDKFTIINNTERKLALRNIYESFSLCRDDEVVVMLDADDELSNPLVLHTLNEVFQDPDTWFIWSQYVNSSNGRIGCSAGIGPEVYINNSFREQSWRFSHLHAFRAKLTRHINKEYLLEDDGKTFFKSGWDGALYMACLELCNTHAKFLNRVLYKYNDQNSISDFRVNEQEQVRLFEMARRRPKLSKLEKL